MASSRLRPGFTLLEALVAMTIFAIISVALALSISTALQAHAAGERRQEESGAVRGVFSTLTRDLVAAYGSVNSTISQFVAPGPQAGGTSSAGPLVTLTTLSQRIDLVQATDTRVLQDASRQARPIQCDCALVQYFFDPANGVLSRSATAAVANPQDPAQPAVRPEPVPLANELASLELRFYDSSTNSWRTDWNYLQSNQPNTGSSAPAQPAAGTGDAAMPAAVEVTLTLRPKPGASMPARYTTIISLMTPEAADLTPEASDSSTGVSVFGASR